MFFKTCHLILFQVHILISAGIEAAFLLPTVFLIIGAAKRVRWLMIPWLVLSGIGQIGLLLGIFACVIWMPNWYKLAALGVAAAQAFVIFPWWFAAMHLFGVLGNLALLTKVLIKSNIQSLQSTILKFSLQYKF